MSIVNDLLARTGDQVRVKRALRLDTGPLRFLTDRDCLTFSATSALASTDSAVRADVSRLASANIRLLELIVAGGISPGDWRQLQIIPVSIPFSDDLTQIAAFITANASAQFFEGTTEPLPRSLRVDAPRPAVRDDVTAAFAYLIDRSALATGVNVEDRATRGRYMLGIRGWLVPRLLELRAANTAEAAVRALAIRVPAIIEETAVFAGARPPFHEKGAVIPSTDFNQLTPGSTIRVAALTTDSRIPSFLTKEFVIGFAATRPAAQLLLTTVPGANIGVTTAVINADQSTNITAAAGFRGTVWFDYRVHGGNGEEATGRVFVFVR